MLKETFLIPCLVDGKKSIMKLDKDAWYKSEGLAMIILYANGNMGGRFHNKLREKLITEMDGKLFCNFVEFSEFKQLRLSSNRRLKS